MNSLPSHRNILAYDRWGRLKYNAEIHTKQHTTWTNHDEKYLIDNYEKDGPEAVSYALGRTIGVIMDRACHLRKKGKMPPRTTTIMHKRLRNKHYD